MKHRDLRRAVGVALLAVAVGGCAGVPSQEMSDARRAIQAAESVDAATFAPQVLGRGRDALGRAEDALGRGDFVLARQAALESRDEAIAAGALAREVRATQEAIDAARAAGRPSGGASALMAAAAQLAGAGDTTRAIAMLERARALAR